MSKRTLYLLLAGFLVGGGIALYLHVQYPKPIQRDDGHWQMPHNPFAKAAHQDWQHVEVTLRVPDESATIAARWHVKTEGDRVERYLEVDGEEFEHGVFSTKEIPSIEEFTGLPPDLISDVAFEKVRFAAPAGRTFDCTKVSFMLHGEDGDWLKEVLFLSKEVKGSGVAAWSMNVNDEFFIDWHVQGFGGKDGADWGKPYDPSSLTAETHEKIAGVMKRLRFVLAKQVWKSASHRPVPQHTDDEVLVDFPEGIAPAEVADFAKRHKIELRLEAHDPSASPLWIAHVPAEREAALEKELESDPLHPIAEHNVFMSIPDEDAFSEFSAANPKDAIPEEDAGKPREGYPNDALFDKQWHMRMIHAPEAWKVTTGKGVIVGVIDTGVAYEKKRGIQLPDLAGTQFVDGYDFVRDDKIAADDQGHGSHCAGTIAQTTDNGRGCAGVAPGATIMPIKVLNSHGSGTLADVCAGIRYAADHGCKVLNLSLGGGGFNKTMAAAVKYAHDKGCVVCCAAGNSGRRRVEFPAAYDGALAVSSVGPSGKRAFYSSYGPEVWVAGPGGDKSKSAEDGVLQNTIDPAAKKSFYGFWQGTSMATPHVAGVAALLVSRGVTNPDAVRDILKKTAMKDGKTGQPRDDELGWGVVDAKAAVDAAGAPDRGALIAVVVLVVLTLLVMRGRDELMRGLLGVGALVGATGLGFLGILPSFSFMHAFPEWGEGSPLFASAAIPFFVGLVCVPNRAARSLAVGLMLGSAAHLLSMAWFDYASIAWIPSSFGIERAWLVVNGLFLIVGSGMVVRLAKGKGVA